MTPSNARAGLHCYDGTIRIKLDKAGARGLAGNCDKQCGLRGLGARKRGIVGKLALAPGGRTGPIPRLGPAGAPGMDRPIFPTV